MENKKEESVPRSKYPLAGPRQPGAVVVTGSAVVMTRKELADYQQNQREHDNDLR